MINHTEIEAFQEDFERVAEYVRRAEAGLPEDRWTDGTRGSAALAASCKRLLTYTSIQAEIMAGMLEDLERIGLASMEASKDPMR